MQAGRFAVLRKPYHARVRHVGGARQGHAGFPCGGRHFVVTGFVPGALGNTRPVPGQKDMTAELLERAFELALRSRLKQHSGIHVDVRSTAWGLLEGKFGGMTVRGYNWRTPLALTAEQLTVDVGELILDYQKLVWQQTVALKNIPQGSVAFTLTSQDLANFMVHPIMVAAAARAVKGHSFAFDRNTASVRLDPPTGRGVITYEGTWAGDGRRYAVTMSTPPPAPPPAAAAARGNGGIATVAASSNTLEQLTVSARRVVPASKSTTGSFASVGSADEPLATAARTTVTAAEATVVGRSGSAGRVVQTLTVAPAALPYGAAVAADAGAGAVALSAASAGSMDDPDVDAGAEVVAEGLRRFFSSLVINLQGIELRNPVLLVQQIPGPSGATGARAGAVRGGGFTASPSQSPPRQRLRSAARPTPTPTAHTPAAMAMGKLPPTSSASASSSSSSRTTAGAGVEAGTGPGPTPGRLDLVPALLTITMKVAILQLPPLDMKF